MATTLNKTKVKKKVWKLFSQYIRLLAQDKNGYVECYTCGVKNPLKKMQAGHWVTGHGNATYINEDYVKPQCYSCNIMRGGNLGEFRDKIRKELGNKIVDQLLIESKLVKDITLVEYLELEKFYKARVADLLKK